MIDRPIDPPEPIEMPEPDADDWRDYPAGLNDDLATSSIIETVETFSLSTRMEAFIVSFEHNEADLAEAADIIKEAFPRIQYEDVMVERMGKMIEKTNKVVRTVNVDGENV